MRRLLKNKKAVSPVIATVLMILIVMAGMTILFAFVGGYAQSFQAGSGSAVLESLTVEDAWFKNINQVEVWVYNIGKVELEINSIYVNASTPQIFVADPPVVQASDHGKIVITLNQAFNSGDHYVLKVVTGRGSAFEGTYSP